MTKGKKAIIGLVVFLVFGVLAAVFSGLTPYYKPLSKQEVVAIQEIKRNLIEPESLDIMDKKFLNNDKTELVIKFKAKNRLGMTVTNYAYVTFYYDGTIKNIQYD